MLAKEKAGPFYLLIRTAHLLGLIQVGDSAHQPPNYWFISFFLISFLGFMLQWMWPVRWTDHHCKLCQFANGKHSFCFFYLLLGSHWWEELRVVSPKSQPLPELGSSWPVCSQFSWVIPRNPSVGAPDEIQTAENIYLLGINNVSKFSPVRVRSIVKFIICKTQNKKTKRHWNHIFLHLINLMVEPTSIGCIVGWSFWLVWIV